MDGSDEHNAGDGGVPVGRAPAVRTADRPAPAVPHVKRDAGRPGRDRRRPPPVTAAAVCVVAASLAVLGWIDWNVREVALPGGRYAVVDTPPDAIGSPPPVLRTSPQPLVPLLPPDRATAADPRIGSRSSKSAAAAPAGRARRPRPTAAVSGPAGAVSGYAGRCLHVPGDDPVDGIPIEMTACDGSPGRRWTFAPDGTLRALGRCLGVVGDAVADGVGVQLSACRGAAGQQWRFTPGRDLVNPHADKCLDVRDFNVADGAVVQLWTCVGGINQKWSVSA